MKQAITKFRSVPSFRNLCIGAAVTASALVATSASAAGIEDGANTALAAAQSSGESVGATVVGVVAALCVVGLVISMVRKV